MEYVAVAIRIWKMSNTRVYSFRDLEYLRDKSNCVLNPEYVHSCHVP